MDLLHRRIKDNQVLRLIKKYLKSGVIENGVISKTEEGSPQGGPLSVNDTLIVDHGDADILDIQSTSFCPCLHI